MINNIRENLDDGVFILNLNDSSILKSKKDTINQFPYDFGKINEPIPRKLQEQEQHKFNKRKEYLPILGAGKKGYNDIPIPNYDDVIRVISHHHKELKEKNASNNNKTQPITNEFSDIYKQYRQVWEEKIDKAVFRGSPSGCGTFDKTNMRIKLSKLSRTTGLSKYVDSCLVGKGFDNIKMDPVYGLSKNYSKDIYVSACPNNKGMPMTQQSNYKYIIHIDGNVNAYRLLNTMLTGSLILRVKSNYIHWADHLLKEGVEYKYISSDLSDIEQVVLWCISHDDICKEIANNSTNIAKLLISSTFINDTFISYFNYLSSNCRDNKTTEKLLAPTLPKTKITKNTKTLKKKNKTMTIKSNAKTRITSKNTSSKKNNLLVSKGGNHKSILQIRKYASINEGLDEKYMKQLYEKYKLSEKPTLEEIVNLNFTRLNEKWLAIYVASYFL